MRAVACLSCEGLVLACLLAASGCLQVNQELELGDHNQGAFKVQASVPLRVYTDFIAAPDSPLAAWADWFSPDRGSARFPEAEGFVLRKYRVYEREDRKYLQIEGELKDVDRALASGKLGHFNLAAKAGGGTVLTLTLPPLPARPPSATREAALHSLTAGMVLNLIVRTPGEIVATTAPVRQKRLVQWTFDATKDPAFLTTPPTIMLEYR